MIANGNLLKAVLPDHMTDITALFINRTMQAKAKTTTRNALISNNYHNNQGYFFTLL